MGSREEKVRRRAYELWEHAGHTGSAEEHWLRAECEMSGDQKGTTASDTDRTNRTQILDAWVMGDDDVPVEPTTVRVPSQTRVDTGAGRVSRARNSLLEFMSSAPRGWPWRLSR